MFPQRAKEICVCRDVNNCVYWYDLRRNDTCFVHVKKWTNWMKISFKSFEKCIWNLYLEFESISAWCHVLCWQVLHLIQSLLHFLVTCLWKCTIFSNSLSPIGWNFSKIMPFEVIAKNALFLWNFNTQRCLTLLKSFKATFYSSFTKIISCLKSF